MNSKSDQQQPEALSEKKDGEAASFLRLNAVGVSATGTGIPIRSVGAVLNAVDSKHFLESMNELIMVATEYDLAVSEVYSVGLVGEKGRETMKSLEHSPQLFALVALQGRMIPAANVPVHYKVNSSPSWLVTTAKGTIIVEGLPALRKIVNRKGELVLDGVATQFAQEQSLESVSSPVGTQK